MTTRDAGAPLVLATCRRVVLCLAALAAASPARADEERAGSHLLQPLDVFQLEYASDPQISPDGSRVVYVRVSMDVMKDERRHRLWIVGADDGDHRPIGAGEADSSSPRWSPDGTRLAYLSGEDGSSQLYLRWMDTGEVARLAQLPREPEGLTWSPDGRWLAFSMFVPEPPEPFVELPEPPEGAEWAPPPRVVQALEYRADGEGFLEDGYHQVFVLPAEGGTPRQLTSGPLESLGRLSFTPDGSAIAFSAHRGRRADQESLNTDLHVVALEDGSTSQLTTRYGPDEAPVVSPDGQWIAFLGFDDHHQGYQVTQLSVMSTDGGTPRVLSADLDRDVEAPTWAPDGSGLYVQYDDEGDTKVAFVGLEGDVEVLADGLGGTSLGRPYAGGSFSVARDDSFAFTKGSTARPADVAIGRHGESGVHRLTALNEDLLAHKTLGAVEELWFTSSHDEVPIQGWIVTPPDFDPEGSYPLLLEIHGGPFANYGGRFSAEAQLYAAAGFVVLYTNPRGSTSYGEEFGNLIHHAYPGHDYDDLMSGVDAVIERGFIDEDRLYVTGGSGGGVLTSWIVGKTDRFRAAVVAKPVINWTSFALTSDAASYFWKYWFPGYPWEHQDHYWERSPLSLVGNVTTPTMLLTGEEDHRTPIAESEQYYQALRLRGIDTALVRMPGASHGIARRPSQLLAKVACILEWFDRYDQDATE